MLGTHQLAEASHTRLNACNITAVAAAEAEGVSMTQDSLEEIDSMSDSDISASDIGPGEEG